MNIIDQIHQHRSIRAYKPDPVPTELLNDVLLVSQNVALAAESHGLGICYMGTTLASCDQIAEILQLPSSVIPVTGFSLGYPAENPTPRYRLPLDGIIHQETYQDYTPERLKEIYAVKEKEGWARYMTYPELRQRIEAVGAENLAQIYTKAKYTRETHQGYSQTVLNLLREQDFFNN